MKELLVISGKGGTGKTTFVSSIAKLSKNIVVADCDVDAPDLHLILNPKVLKEFEFKGGELAYIDKTKCKECGICISVCEFHAISEDYVVDNFSCEGCWVCQWKCPYNAITMKEKTQGKYFISEITTGKMVHAKLNPAEENSGKLVTEVKKLAREVAEKEGVEKILIDGSPGIGCPVIASFGNINVAIIITEPTVSGLHDLKRVIELAEFFKVNSKVIINKFDLNIDKTIEIEDYCKGKNIDIIAKIPFSKEIIEALNKGLSIVEYNTESEISKIFRDLSVKLWEEK